MKKNEITMDDLFQEVGNLSNVDSLNFKYENYDFMVKDGEKFIIGYYEDEDGRRTGETINNPFQDKNQYERPDLLFSLIRLVKDNEIADEDLMKWVKQYGMPHTDNQLHVEKFMQCVRWLHDYFSLWKALFEEDKKEINILKNVVDSELKTNEFLLDNKGKDELTMIKEALSAAVSSWIKVNLQVEYNQKTQTFGYVLQAESLISIAYIQLAALMTKPQTEIKKSLKICQVCNKVYWADRPNSKYCKSKGCSKQNRWNKEHNK